MATKRKATAKPTSHGTRYLYRSAITGMTVTKDYALKHPDITVREVLTDRYRGMIVFEEPVPGLSISGMEVTCSQRVFMTEEDAIKAARYARSVTLKKLGKPGEALTDKQLLDEFMIIHWATRQ